MSVAKKTVQPKQSEPDIKNDPRYKAYMKAYQDINREIAELKREGFALKRDLQEAIDKQEIKKVLQRLVKTG